MAYCRVRFLILIQTTAAEQETTKTAIVRATFSGTVSLAKACSVADIVLLGVAVSIGCGGGGCVVVGDAAEVRLGEVERLFKTRA